MVDDESARDLPLERPVAHTDDTALAALVSTLPERGTAVVTDITSRIDPAKVAMGAAELALRESDRERAAVNAVRRAVGRELARTGLTPLLAELAQCLAGAVDVEPATDGDYDELLEAHLQLVATLHA